MNTTNHPYLAPPPPTTTQPTRPSTLTLLPPSSTASLFPTPTSSFNSLFNTPTSTPIVITPNTLKTIEQSILQTLGEDTEESFLMESQQYSGNFVPPLPSSTNTITLINTWQGGQVSSECNGEEPKMQVEQEQEDDLKSKSGEMIKEDGTKKKGRGSVKRTPAPRQPKQKKSPANSNTNAANTTPSQPKQRQPKAPRTRDTEEDERRRIRRERNKLAAARCRKRRVDHTNKLLEETDGLEAKKRALQNQITELQSQKEELEFILEAHTCVKKVIKNEVLADLQNLPRVSEGNHGVGGGKLKRPTSLNVATSSEGPIPISTPSNGIAGLGFDSLCSEWPSVGNTPIDDANVPDSGNKANSLVTPVNPYPFKKLQDL